MRLHALISDSIGRIVNSLTDNDKIQIEVNGYERWANLLDIWNYVNNKITNTVVYTDFSFGFASSALASGSIYAGGFYEFSGTNNDFSPAINYGSENNAKAAHFFIVTGAETVDEVTITVTGTTITDLGVRTTSDVETITIPAATPVNSYFEFGKFLGQITVETTGGTAIQCNYGWSKYWDDRNTDFNINALDATWFSESNNSASDLILRHHKTTGWTYNAGANPTPPTPIAQMSTDYGTERNIDNGEFGAWKRTNLDVDVAGSNSEGIIVELIAGAAKAFTFGNFVITVKT